jgi:hypothetical protein
LNPDSLMELRRTVYLGNVLGNVVFSAGERRGRQMLPERFACPLDARLRAVNYRRAGLS